MDRPNQHPAQKAGDGDTKCWWTVGTLGMVYCASERNGFRWVDRFDDHGVHLERQWNGTPPLGSEYEKFPLQEIPAKVLACAREVKVRARLQGEVDSLKAELFEAEVAALKPQLAAIRPKPKRKSALWIFAKKLWPTREVWRVTSITLLFLVPMWFGAYMSVFTELFMTPPEYAKDGDISEGGRIGQWIWGLGLFGSLLWGLLICFVVIPSCQWLVKTWREAKKEAGE